MLSHGQRKRQGSAAQAVCQKNRIHAAWTDCPVLSRANLNIAGKDEDERMRGSPRGRARRSGGSPLVAASDPADGKEVVTPISFSRHHVGSASSSQKEGASR